MATTDYLNREPRPDGQPAPEGDRAVPARTRSAPGWRRPVGSFLLAGGFYLICSLIVWFNVWTTHPTSVTTCGCGDSSLFTWFLAWPAYAVSHGLNPLYSTALFHPTGVNLLSNTGVVGIGLVLAPVTWLFGPIATLNVALTLAPVLSALAMFALLRRWVDWGPAAFAGGLLYGFSPFILISLTDSHLMLGMSPFPPLLVLCLDEILVRQRRRPAVGGVALGVLVSAQYFVGSEVLVIVAIAALVGIVLLLAYSIRHTELVRRRARHASVALGAAGATAVLLLAYPVWFTLAGPAHLSGRIWPGYFAGIGGSNLHDYVLPAAASVVETRMSQRLGGYQAGTLSNQYLGIGLVVVLVVGTVIWRRDRRLWLFGAVGLVSVPFSFGEHKDYWTPWRLFIRIPQVDNVVPSRFELVTYLCAAVMLAVIVDHTRTAIDQRRISERRTVSGAPPRFRRVMAWPRAGAMTATVVAVMALAPIAAYFATGLPFTTQPVALPSWFRTVAPHLGGHQVILAFPVPFALLESAMTWQAVDGMHFALVGGGGPGGISQRAGSERAGQDVIGSASIAITPPSVTPSDVTEVRRALDGWGVTTVVLPDTSHLPLYERVVASRQIAVLITAATGERPVFQDDAWVWSEVDRAGPASRGGSALLSQCASGPEDVSASSIDQATACVLEGSS